MIDGLGERLQRLRITRTGKTQEELGEDPAFGINSSTLATYERNLREPRPRVLIQLALFYGVSVDYLLGLSEHETPENNVMGSEIPLSDSALNFLKSCPRDKLDILSMVLSAPSAGNFLTVLRGYLEEPQPTDGKVPDKYLPLLDHLNRTISDEQFNAMVESWNWDGVSASLKDVASDILKMFDQGAGLLKVGRPKKYKKHTKKAAPDNGEA